jgi:FMN phosphatase YigB (HAD superfamily)
MPAILDPVLNPTGFRTTPDHCNVVKVIHTQLESLKYVGTVRDNVPTGEGVDVSIVLLPDLVFDIREGFKDFPSRKICTVGGRAGRMTSILLHLLDQEDGTYRINLLTKTGNLGRLLLENEHTIAGSTRAVRHLDMETVFPRDGQPRCALVKDVASQNGSKGFRIYAQAADPNKEVDAACLQKPQAQRVLKRAKTIGLTSITTPHFSALFRKLLSLPNPQAIFVDTTRPGPKNLDGLLQELRYRKQNPENQTAELVLFVPEETEALLKRNNSNWSLCEFCREFQIGVIRYGSDPSILYCPPGGDGEAQVASGVKFDHEDIPERFKAGVLLASTLFRSLKDIPDSHEGFRSQLLRQWPTDGPWSMILEYGVALALAEKNSEGFCTLKELLQMTDRAIEPHWPDLKHFSPLTNATEPIPGETSGQLKLTGVLAEDFARMAGFRRVHAASFGESKPGFGSGLCPALAAASAAHVVEDPASWSRGAAVLFDLDATLIDSTEQRSLALLSSFRCLSESPHSFASSHQFTPEQAVKFFDEHVYKPWPLYSLMRLGDFRQTWNHEGWYAAFIVLWSKPQLAEQLLQGWGDVDKRKKPHEQAKEAASGAWWKNWIAQFRKLYQRALLDHADLIRGARTAFELVTLAPMKEARDVLKTLDQTGAFSLYVVSEGDPETQWLKIKSTGRRIFQATARADHGGCGGPNGRASSIDAGKDQTRKGLCRTEGKIQSIRHAITTSRRHTGGN